jgi:hypothetical protein
VRKEIHGDRVRYQLRKHAPWASSEPACVVESPKPVAREEAFLCGAPCPLSGMGHRTCELAPGHADHHEAHVNGEPPLTWSASWPTPPAPGRMTDGRFGVLRSTFERARLTQREQLEVLDELDRARHVEQEQAEMIRLLAKTLRAHARHIPCPSCEGLGSRTCATCDHGETPTHHPDVVFALRRAGEFP